MSAAWDRWPSENPPLFEDPVREEPGRTDRAPFDAALMLVLTITTVVLGLTLAALVLFRSPLRDLVALPARIVAGLGS
jgi:hypothetical protein